MKLSKARNIVKENEQEESEMISYMNYYTLCAVTGKLVPDNYHPHRIQSAGAGGKYEYNNMIRLSPAMHAEAHKIGNHEFCIRYRVEKIRERLKEINSWNEQDEKRYIERWGE